MKKLFSLESLKKFLKKKKIKKKNIILCHGVFDIIHIGHMQHFKSAKNVNNDKKNFLIVTTTADKFINKGFGRPYFDQNIRLEALSNLEIIDAVALSNQPSCLDVIKKLKPGYYIKGPDYKNNKNDKTGKIYLEKKTLEKLGGKIIYTNDDKFSSSKIINKTDMIFNDKQREIFSKIKNKINFREVDSQIDKLKKLRVTVLGELIFDEYYFGNVVGKAGKEPHLVQVATHKECYLGGSAAVARNVSEFVKSVNLISFFGNEEKFEKILKEKLQKNITFRKFKPYQNFSSIIKKRFIDLNSKYKLHGYYYISDFDVNKNNKFIEKRLSLSKGGMLIVTDYAHNLISDKIIKKIKKKFSFIAVNAQLNSTNRGSHKIYKYYGVDLIIVNETELRNELRDDVSDIVKISKQFLIKQKIKNLVITRGSSGAILIDSNRVYECPAFVSSSVDKVGAGDSMLSLISICLKNKIDKNLCLLLGCYAGFMSVQHMANKEFIKKFQLKNFLEYSLE